MLISNVLIIGSGAAGLTVALRVPKHLKVHIISKNIANDGSTYFAQGGISAVLNEKDSFQSHCNDTISAGDGVCHNDVVEKIVASAPEAIDWLIKLGVDFSTDKNQYHLTKEGGHSFRRVFHAADTTGKTVHQALLNEANSRDNITLFEQSNVVDLITDGSNTDTKKCAGAYVLDKKTGKVHRFLSNTTVLATGGASKVYLYTSNPDGSTGDGIAMAWRAGCRVSNMEFMQFHPTCLYHPQAKSFLISEALRGEGAKLTLPDGTAFMEQYHPLKELAPRDVVARAIDDQMKRLGLDFVLLDISHKTKPFILQHFPAIYQRCLDFGYDISAQAIPIVPAAHYTCGGVLTNTHGETDLPNLYAVGEVACTGFHGANRLASNSLLECFAIGFFSAEKIAAQTFTKIADQNIPKWDKTRVTQSTEEIIVSHNWDELRKLMWDYVGIVRSNKRLERANLRIDLLLKEVNEYYTTYHLNNDLLELRNLSQIAQMIITSAKRRTESRGLHYSLDFPYKSPQKIDTILTPTKFNPKHAINFYE
jgi:L-aspartate oxidase